MAIFVLPGEPLNVNVAHTMKKIRIIFCTLVLMGGWSTTPHAAIVGVYTQTPSGVAATFDMASTQSLTYNVRNANTGADTGRCFSRVRFRVQNGTTFSSATAAPSGWTRGAITTGTTTSVTFAASSPAGYIPLAASLNFTLVLVMRTAGADSNETLRDVRPSYTNTTCTTGTTNSGNVPTGAWSVRSLAIATFQITDLGGTAMSAATAGTNFRLVMTVRNNSNVTQNNIVSNPNPPTAVKTGTVTQVLTGTVGSPLNLAAGASGTITFTYSTVGTDSGTIYFTADARNGATVTSRLATSATLAVSPFAAAIAPSLACQYAGSNITISMTLSNNFPYSILNVTPTLTPAAGAPVTYVSGPTPAAPIANVPVSPPTTGITWVYQINAIGGTNPFTFSGSATGTGNTGGSPIVTTQTTISSSISRGGFTVSIDPAVVNAASTNVELKTTVTNNGCASVNSVAITAPAGWTGASDAYSLVSLSAISAIETWTSTGANPIIFTAPNIAGQMPVLQTGDFSIVYATTPVAATASIFIIRVTDANGNFADVPFTVTVNAFKSGTINNATNLVWREEFR